MPSRPYRIDVPVMHAVVRELPKRTTLELSVEYNNRVPPERRVNRDTFVRALKRAGYRFLKAHSGPQNVAEVVASRRATKP